jgi:hypothetical protein
VSNAAPASIAAAPALPAAEPGTILHAVREIFEKAGEVRDDFRSGYAGIFDRKMPVKTFKNEFKVRRARALGRVPSGRELASLTHRRPRTPLFPTRTFTRNRRR